MNGKINKQMKVFIGRKEIQDKINNLSLPRRHAVCPVLIHLGDVSDMVRDAGFFYRVVDIASFLQTQDSQVT